MVPALVIISRILNVFQEDIYTPTRPIEVSWKGIEFHEVSMSYRIKSNVLIKQFANSKVSLHSLHLREVPPARRPRPLRDPHRPLDPGGGRTQGILISIDYWMENYELIFCPGSIPMVQHGCFEGRFMTWISLSSSTPRRGDWPPPSSSTTPSRSSASRTRKCSVLKRYACVHFAPAQGISVLYLL